MNSLHRLKELYQFQGYQSVKEIKADEDKETATFSLLIGPVNSSSEYNISVTAVNTKEQEGRELTCFSQIHKQKWKN